MRSETVRGEPLVGAPQPLPACTPVPSAERLERQEVAAATAEAGRLGWASQYHPVDTPADLDRETKALADHIAAQPPQQIASGKAMFRAHMEMNVEQAYAYATDFMAGAIQIGRASCRERVYACV